MKNRVFLALIVITLISGISLADDSQDYIEGQLLVRFAGAGYGLDSPDPGEKAAARQLILDEAGGGTVVHMYERISGWALVKLPAGQCVESMLPQYSSTPGIIYVEPNYRAELFNVPNDTRFSDLWAMRNNGQGGGKPDADIDATDAWDFGTGNSDIIVAVIDSGMDYTHPDLSSNMWENVLELTGIPGQDDDGNGYIDDIYGYDFSGATEEDPDDGDGDPCDVFGHGTHVAGTIGAVGNNNRGVTGVCWDVRLMALKIGADDSGPSVSSGDAVLAIEYAIDMGADVMNASWGGYSYSQALRDAIAEARNAGLIFVAAAGNENLNIDSIPAYPAAYDLDNIISVLATNNIDEMSYYSNYGATNADIGAPGGDFTQGDTAGAILSTYPGGGYAFGQGTSMAAPHVAGSCALLLSLEPELSYTEIKELLMDTADPLAVLSGRCVSGARLNIGNAVKLISIDEEPPTPDPSRWASWGLPKATGLSTIAMQAEKAQDNQGVVQYYFECVTDSNFDSGWQNGTFYVASGLAQGTEYTFRVRTRDSVENMTGWSVQSSATTDSGTDTSTPFTDPPLWNTNPYAFRLTPVWIIMKAQTGSDESGIEYRFEETTGTNYNSGWQDSSTLNIIGNPQFTIGNTYTFRFQVRDKSPAQNTSAFSEDRSMLLKYGPKTLPVPSHYYPIQAAIDAASAGDIVVISQGTYSGLGNTNLEFHSGVPITVTSTDPNNPAVVATTVIDCAGEARGFDFGNREGPDTVVAGLTIRNGRYIGLEGTPGSPGVPGDEGDPADPCDDIPEIPPTAGGPGGDARGGGIICINSSPTIYKCVLDGCVAEGGDGGEPNGGPNGGAAGSAYGGGIYCNGASDPVIIGCEIVNCSTEAGEAKDTAFTIGDSFGGGIYLDRGSKALIEDCAVRGCTATDENSGIGRAGGVYHGLATGTVSIIDTTITGNRSDNDDGGGIYFEQAGDVILSNCEISFNEAVGNGGGIYYPEGHSLTIENGSRIYNNQSIFRGGGIYAGDITQTDSAELNITDSSVTHNSALFGAGIYMDETTLSISDSDISNNSAFEGAGINGAFSDVRLVSSTINNNEATSGAGIGGGIALWNSTGEMIDCRMQGNIATGTSGIGGALYFNGFDSSPKSLVNCLISENQAGIEGAGLFCHLGAWAEVTNCTIADNSVLSSVGSGGGISCAEYASIVQLENSIVYGNSAPDGPQIAAGRVTSSSFDAHAVVTVDYSDVQGGEDDVFQELPYAVVLFGTGNWDEENPFVSTGGDEPTYFLRHFATGQVNNSNLVDNGTGNAGDLISQVGYDLTTRIDGVIDTGTVDIGYHYPATEVVVPSYQLTIRVDRYEDFDVDGFLKAEGPGLETIFARNEPNTISVLGGVEVRLTAVADSGFEIARWTGADDVPNIGDPCNIVTMNSDKEVVVYFQPDGTYYLYTDVPTDNGHIDYVNGDGLRVEHPGRTIHEHDEVVQIFAVPGNPLHVPHWSGTDDDDTISKENTVTMDSEKFVSVSFIEPRTLYAGSSEYPTIQRAIDAANPGDIVLISAGTWNIYQASQGHDHLELFNKDITITGENPDDPNTTLIQGGFIIGGVTRNTLIQGLTITGNYRYADQEWEDPDPGWDGVPGRPQHGGGMQLHQVNDFLLPYPQVGRRITEKFNSGSPTVRNCIFRNCSVIGTNGSAGEDGEDGGQWGGGNGGIGSWAHGGAVSCGPDSNPIFENCVFEDCFARGGDGGNGANGGEGYRAGHGGSWGDENGPDPDRGVYWDWGPHLPYWKYSGYGGAVYVDSNCSVEFVNCTFIDNYVQGGSCGISGTVDGIQYTGWPYQHYKIDRFGGAIYAAGGSSPVFVDCNFIDNIGDTNALPTHYDGTATSTFDVYEELSYGGGIAFEEGATVTLKSCNFADNTADVGGGVYCLNSKHNITDCNIYNNTANHGGGILCVGGSGLIKSCKLTSNRAIGSGGAGGGITCLGSNTNVLDCEITDNQALGGGGGLYISSKDIDGDDVVNWPEISVRNCLIAKNTAGLNGAGISSNWHSFVDIELCTIAENSVLGSGYGGGLYSSNGNYSTVTNCILWDNVATNGRQVAIRPSTNPAGVSVSYTDIRGGNTYTQPPDTGGNIWVDQDCLFDAGPGNIGADVDDDPLFVSGVLGDYYLSQIITPDPAQTVDSPCVDAGSDSASSLDIQNRTTRTDMVPDRGIVDMGYHYKRDTMTEICSLCDLVFDGVIDMADMDAFTQQWLREDCSDENGWCGGADFNYDTVVDLEDESVISSCWMVEDTQPPIPNPSEWQIVPFSNSTSSISMTAKKTYDMWGKDVQYYFECSDANHSSSWREQQNFVSQGLTAGRQYGFRVKARDQWGNETKFSGFASAVVNEDSSAPTPNPMTWAVLPAAVSNTEITMTASVATDSSGVEYGFRRIGGQTVWQDERTFVDTGLEAQTEYTYQTAARDKSDNHNTTEWSALTSATTSETPTAPDTEPPVTGVYANIYKATFAITPDEVLVSGEGYYHQMTAFTATDDTPPVEYRFICLDDSRFSSGWQIDPYYEVIVSTLQSKSNWKWQVRTRDSAEPTPNLGVLSNYWDCQGNSYPYP